MDDCKTCEHLEECRTGKRIVCPWEIITEIYNINMEKINDIRNKKSCRRVSATTPH